MNDFFRMQHVSEGYNFYNDVYRFNLCKICVGRTTFIVILFGMGRPFVDEVLQRLSVDFFDFFVNNFWVQLSKTIHRRDLVTMLFSKTLKK